MERERRFAGETRALVRDQAIDGSAAEPDRPVVGKRSLVETTIYRSAEDPDGMAEDPAVDAALARVGAGRALPRDVQQRMEGVLGVALDRVRLHTDAAAASAARTVRAAAFTVGEDIFFADGAFAPETPNGAHLLAHELAHVVQGWQGRTSGGGGRRISQPGEPLEREAEVVAARTATPAPAGGQPVHAPAAPAPQATIHRSATGDRDAPAQSLDEVYKAYRAYKAARQREARALALGGMNARAAAAAVESPAEKRAEALRAQLRQHGFPSIDAFESFVGGVATGLVRDASVVAMKLLADYAAQLGVETRSYGDPNNVAALHQKLAPFRAQHARFEANATVANNFKRDSELSQLPGNAHLRPAITSDEAFTAHERAAQAREASRVELAGLAAQHPVFQEDGLPVDKRIDKEALAHAGEVELGRLVQAQIARRLMFVGQAHTLLASQPAAVCQSQPLMQRFYSEKAIAEGSLYDMILRDKIADEQARAAEVGIALVLVSIALAVLSLGAAVPAIVATGAAAASLALSLSAAHDEYKAYTKQQQLADAGYADDPTVAWLVVAVVGALVDVAAVARAARAFEVISRLGRDAKALSRSGKLTEFTAKVDAMKDLEPKVANAVKDAAVHQATAGERKALADARELRDVIRDDLEIAQRERAGLAKQRGGSTHALDAKDREIRKLKTELGIAHRTVDKAGGNLVAAEREAAKLVQTPYQRLRRAVEDKNVYDQLLRGVTQDKVGTLKTKPTGLSVEHIVSIREIVDLDGFTKLSLAEQKAIANIPENLIPMDRVANSTRQNVPWRSWSGAAQFYDQAAIAKMIEREAKARALIEAETRTKLAELSRGKP